MKSILTSVVGTFDRISKYNDGITVTYRDNEIDLENSTFKLTKISNSDVTMTPVTNIKTTDSIKFSNCHNNDVITIQLETM